MPQRLSPVTIWVSVGHQLGQQSVLGTPATLDGLGPHGPSGEINSPESLLSGIIPPHLHSVSHQLGDWQDSVVLTGWCTCTIRK
mmetsp:Transcript_114017/g.198187  ORF Transcript_114017/g.198187 Transcript_114017/m.198187 type:complete len:84 (+) Transcript_114017:166-417(+)